MDSNLAWRRACFTDYPSLQNSPSRSNWTQGDTSADQGGVAAHDVAGIARVIGGYRFGRAVISMATTAAIKTERSERQRRLAVLELEAVDGRAARNLTDFEDDWDQQIKQQPTEYLRAAARFQALKAEVTTPRVIQYLRE